MFLQKEILIFGVVFVCFFCLTQSDDSSEETKIKKPKEVMVEFFTAVHNLDVNLKVPDDFKKLKKVRSRYWKIGFSIKNKESHFKDFLKEYGKLVKYTKDIVKDYIKEINNDSPYRNIGNSYLRQQFCGQYNTKFFDEKLKLKGFGINNEELKGFQKDLKDEAKKLVDRISSLVDLYIPTPQVPIYDNGGGDTTIIFVETGGGGEEASSESDGGLFE